MKTDNSGIDIEQFVRILETTFPIGRINSTHFIPKGEEGYGYLLKTISGKNYFAKVLKEDKNVNIVIALTGVSLLYNQHGKKYVVAPIATYNCENAVKLNDNWISLYPYIYGNSLYEENKFTNDIETAAKMMADLHNVDSKIFEQLPRELFQNPFKETITKLIQVSEQHDFYSNSYKKQTSILMLKERKDIESTLEIMQLLQKRFNGLNIELAVTHGDPNLSNILRDSNDHLHLIDWGAIAIGPVERDLISFAELDFEKFLLSYFTYRPQTNIYPELFEFYFYRWCLQEIADYGSRLLLQSNNGEEENKHNWIELQPYLPIPHQSIKNKVNQIKKVVCNLRRHK